MTASGLTKMQKRLRQWRGIPHARRPRIPDIHLPSVHFRGEDGDAYDYEEDYLIGQRGTHRIVRVTLITDSLQIRRLTHDVLCEEDLANFNADMPWLAEPDNEIAGQIMRERAEAEVRRQLRIAEQLERVCSNCGCSETRACSGGCGWASPTICSRCDL